MPFHYLRAMPKSEGSLYIESKTHTQKIKIQINIHWGLSRVSRRTRPRYDANGKAVGVETINDDSYQIVYSSLAPETATYIINGEIKWEYSIVKGRNSSEQINSYSQDQSGYMMASLKTLKATMFTKNAYYVFGDTSTALSNYYALDDMSGTGEDQISTRVNLINTYGTFFKNELSDKVKSNQSSFALDPSVREEVMPMFNNLRLVASYGCYISANESYDVRPTTQASLPPAPSIMEVLVIRGYQDKIRKEFTNGTIEWSKNPKVAGIENLTKDTPKSRINVSNFLQTTKGDFMLEPGSLIGKADYEDKKLQSWYDLKTPIPTTGKMITFIEQDIVNVQAKNLSTQEIITIT